ncbi:MAG TPA: DUF1697 domain-containing protein [Allosphingosinicella sp.]|nr:DUF1697 domain-containing protein [Allosphingosinicella sp.]
MERFVALLRGINVGGRNRIAMAELRALGAKLGWSDVATYIQSGNLVFTADDEPARMEAALEAAIATRLGIAIPVIVRSASRWAAYPPGNPFAEAAEKEPNRLMLMLSKQPPEAGAAAGLRERARDGERIEQAGDALWVHFPAGSGTSRLAPSLFDRLVGSPVTARNFRTVVKLQEMLAG